MRPSTGLRTGIGADAELAENTRLGISAFFTPPASGAEGLLAEVRVEETTIPSGESAVGGLGTAPDPIGFGGGDANLYAYVANDPVNLIDPDGQEPITLGTLALVGLGVAADYVYDTYLADDVSAIIDGMIGVENHERLETLENFIDIGRSIKNPVRGIVKAARGSANPKVLKKALKGIQKHKEYDWGPGWKKEVSLPSGKRMDAYNPGTKTVGELKPNNARQKRRGEKQLTGYCEECDELDGLGPGHNRDLRFYDDD